jgi:hypothetical protein
MSESATFWHTFWPTLGHVVALLPAIIVFWAGWALVWRLTSPPVSRASTAHDPPLIRRYRSYSATGLYSTAGAGVPLRRDRPLLQRHLNG